MIAGYSNNSILKGDIMNINESLNLLQLSVPFTEQEMRNGYRIALLLATQKNDKERIKDLTEAFWQVNNYIRMNPFMRDKNGAREVKEGRREVHPIMVTEKCKKCTPLHIGRGMFIPSGKARIICPKCHGQKKVWIPSKRIVVDCIKCKGTGITLTKCKYCQGTGKLNLKRKIFEPSKQEVVVAKSQEVMTV